MNYKKQITEILNQWKADNNTFRRIVSHGEITFEMQPISVFINGGKP